jgi:hypothetical protein
MARPLRIEVAGAWDHRMNRGHRGGALFLEGAHRRRFLGAVAELPERFAQALADDPGRKQFVAKLRSSVSTI